MPHTTYPFAWERFRGCVEQLRPERQFDLVSLKSLDPRQSLPLVRDLPVARGPQHLDFDVLALSVAWGAVSLRISLGGIL